MVMFSRYNVIDEKSEDHQVITIHPEGNINLLVIHPILRNEVHSWQVHFVAYSMGFNCIMWSASADDGCLNRANSVTPGQTLSADESCVIRLKAEEKSYLGIVWANYQYWDLPSNRNHTAITNTIPLDWMKKEL